MNELNKFFPAASRSHHGIHHMLEKPILSELDDPVLEPLLKQYQAWFGGRDTWLPEAKRHYIFQDITKQYLSIIRKHPIWLDLGETSLDQNITILDPGVIMTDEQQPQHLIKNRSGKYWLSARYQLKGPDIKITELLLAVRCEFYARSREVQISPDQVVTSKPETLSTKTGFYGILDQSKFLKRIEKKPLVEYSRLLGLINDDSPVHILEDGVIFAYPGDIEIHSTGTQSNSPDGIRVIFKNI